MKINNDLTRRQTLGWLAGAAATTVVAACGSSSHPAAGHSPGGASAVPESPTGSASRSSAIGGSRAPSAADWRALKRSLNGTLRRRSDTGYAEESLLFDRRFDSITPMAIARVATAGDVSRCIAFARRFSIPLTIRSGGHSYIGGSTGTGFVIDLRSMAAVAVDASAHTATVGAGAALVDVYSTLAAQGVSIPAGSCPSVGLSGLALGGGIGVVAREYGLTCDRLVSAKVVLATGELVTASATSHSDLYWALRGGGGSFGVVTSLTLGTHVASPLAHAFVTWPWSAAASVVAAWQPWATAAPSSLWSSCHILATGTPGEPTISVAAVMVDSESALQQQIGRLTQSVSASPIVNSVTTSTYEQTMMLESGCSTLSVMACHVEDETPGGTLPRDAFVAGSDFFSHPIPAAGISALVAAVAARQADSRLGSGGASLDILGGTVDSLSDSATAWSHRGALFDAQYTASWGTTPGNGPLARNQHSLASIHKTVHKYARGDAYQNYADDTLASPQQAYYGANLARLVDVRRTYDPSGVFTQKQGVPLTT